MHKARLHTLWLAVIAALAAGPAQAADFVLVNKSGIVVNELYVSPCAGRHWGPNQLIGTALESSRSFTVSNLRPGCYDLRIILPPWNECTINGAAIFRSLVWTISWSTATEASFANCSRIAHIVPSERRPWIPYNRDE